jgi:PGDYG protein
MSVGFEVRPVQIATSTARIGDVGGDLSAALTQLIAVMTDLGDVWGDDDLGRGFFYGTAGRQGFRDARDALVSEAEDLVDLLGGVGERGVQMARTYQKADGQPLSGTPGAVATNGRQVPVPASGLIKDDPPPGWAIWVLDELQRLVAGCTYPRGDAEGVAELAARLDRFASAAHTAQTAVAQHAKTVTTGNAGASVDAFGGHAADLTKGLAWLTEAGETLAAHCRLMANEIRAGKTQFIVAASILVGVLAAAQAMALITLGTSEEAALAEAETEGFALRRMLAEALARVGSSAETLNRIPFLKQALTGAAYIGGQNLAGQAVRDHYGLQSGNNVASLAAAAGIGAVGGAAIGGTQTGVAALDAVDAGVATLAAKALTKNSLGRLGVGAAGGFVVNTGIDAALHDGKVNWTDDAVTSLGMAGYGAAFHRVAQRVNINSPEMTEQFAQSPVFRKSAVVQVTIADGGEVIKTKLANATHAETDNIANPGDGIVTNPGGEQYIIRAANLDKRYDHIEGDTYQAKGMVRAFRNPGIRPVMITAPWGERMRGEPNAWFANVYDPENPGVLGSDRYIIGAQEFADTYGPYDPPAP